MADSLGRSLSPQSLILMHVASLMIEVVKVIEMLNGEIFEDEIWLNDC
jgi:hypothetical protein